MFCRPAPRPRLLLALVLLLLIGSAASLHAGRGGAAAEDHGWTTTETHIINPKDQTKIHAYIHRPTGLPAGARTPVILRASPYVNSGGGGPFLGSPTPTRQPPFVQPALPYLVKERGFTEIAIEPRGYGGSSGCSDFGGPGEQSDVAAAITWAADQPWSTGKVGIFGFSYEGGLAASAVRSNPRGLAAAFLGVPVTSYYRYAQTNGVNNVTGGEVIYNVPQGVIPPSVNEPAQYHQAYVESAAEDPRCQTAGGLATATQFRETDPYWAERDFTRNLPAQTVPVFFAGALQDENVVPSYILDYVNALTGPKRVWLGQWQHEYPTAGQYGAEWMRWFEHYVADRPVPITHGYVIQSSDGTWRTDTSWPHDDVRPLTVPLVDGSYRELVTWLGSGHENDLIAGVPAAAAEASAPGVHWAAVTQALDYDVHISGESTFRAHVATELPIANVVVTVLDIGSDGVPHYLTRGAYLAEGTGEIEFRLFPQEWKLPAGHRIGVVLSGSSSEHYNASNRWIGTSGQQVTVTRGSLTVPTLAHRRLPCTFASTDVETVDVVWYISQAQRDAAAVEAELPGAFVGDRPCSPGTRPVPGGP